jgi:hypothetical protein
MPGRNFEIDSGKVSASIDKDSSISDQNIQMHLLSIKNLTSDWMEFDGALIDGSKNVQVLMGDRLKAWMEASLLTEAEIQRTLSTGQMLNLDSVTALTAKEYQSSKRKNEFQNAFPETHIFRPFLIPPGKVIQRWIVVENRNQEEFDLRLKNKQGDDFNLKVTK